MADDTTQPIELVDPQLAAELRGVPSEVAATLPESPLPPNQRLVGSQGATVRLTTEDDAPVVTQLEAGAQVLVAGFVLDSAGATWFVTSGGRARAGQFTDDDTTGLDNLTEHSQETTAPSIETDQTPVIPAVVVLDAETEDRIATLIVQKLLAAQASQP